MQWQHLVSLVLLACVACAAWAQSTPDKPLDLRLRAQTAAYPAPGATAAGAFFGDVDGHDRRVVGAGEQPVDGGKLHVHGSVSTSVGYAKGHGTGFSNAAEINMSKVFEGGGGFNLQMGMRKDDGFTPRGPYLYAAPRLH